MSEIFTCSKTPRFTLKQRRRDAKEYYLTLRDNLGRLRSFPAFPPRSSFDIYSKFIVIDFQLDLYIDTWHAIGTIRFLRLTDFVKRHERRGCFSIVGTA